VKALQDRTTLVTALERRQDVDDDDIPDIIGLAERLQARSREEGGSVSVQEVQAVAAELGIEATFVEEAIAQREAEKQARAQAARSRARLRRRGLQGVAALLAAAMLGLVGLGAVGAGPVRASARHVEEAESALVEVVERQATLAPQLLASVGGDAGALDVATAALRQAPDVEARLEASAELSAAMARELARLPESEDGARLNLSYEITGTQNRITAEARRYRAAQAEHRRLTEKMSGRAAVWLGLAGDGA
jgi:hypothetical protein